MSRTIDAPAAVVWDLLIDTRRWPEWGSSIRAAELDGTGHRIHAGATGTVTTAVGVDLPFRVIEWSDGRAWRWRVAGIPATGHSVEPLGDHRCRASMDVPVWGAPYAVVLRSALGAVDRLATTP